MTTLSIHTFDTTGDAYDSCQCDESIKNGDLLVVSREDWRGERTGKYDDYGFELREHEDAPVAIAVVGLAWAWPVAVTKAHGNLHALDGKPGALERVMADAGWSDEQVRAACSKARELGAELAPEFAAYVEEVA